MEARLAGLTTLAHELAGDRSSSSRSRRCRHGASASRRSQTRLTRRGGRAASQNADAAGGQSGHGRARRAENAARHLQRAAAAGGPDRLLVQPLQRRRAQGPGPLHADRVRARRDPAARPRQVPRSARGDRQEPGDALLSRQLDERRSERTAPDDQQMRPRVGQSGRGRRAARPHAPAATPAPQANAQKDAERTQRELRPRADGAAHARRRRRLHAEGRDRSGARVHGLDDSEPAAGRRLSSSIRASTIAARRSCSGT